MGKMHIAVEPRLRQADDDKTAKSLYEQHRRAQARIQEIHHQPRTISRDDSDAAQMAQAGIPFRRAHGHTTSDVAHAVVQEANWGGKLSVLLGVKKRCEQNDPD